MHIFIYIRIYTHIYMSISSASVAGGARRPLQRAVEKMKERFQKTKYRFHGRAARAEAPAG